MRMNLMIIVGYMKKKRGNITNKKLGELPIHQFLKQITLKRLLWHFDAAKLYTSAMNAEKSVYPSLATAYAFTPIMNDELVENFLFQFFIQSAISKMKKFNPKT